MFLIPMYGSWEDLPGFPLLVYRVPWIGLAGVWRPGPDGVLNQARRGAVGALPLTEWSRICPGETTVAGLWESRQVLGGGGETLTL